MMMMGLDFPQGEAELDMPSLEKVQGDVTHVSPGRRVQGANPSSRKRSSKD